MTQFEYPVESQLDELQQGANIIRLDQAATDDHESHEYEASHIVAAIRTFVEAGGSTVEAAGTKYGTTDACLMDEKPSFLSTYPYADRLAQPTGERLLIIVNPELELDPKVIARQLGPADLKSKTFLFPELGVVLAADGLSKILKVDGRLADLMHEALAVPHFELETSRRGILARNRLTRAADRIRDLIHSRGSQASTPEPELVSPDAVLTVHRSKERQESIYGKVRTQRRVEIAESWLSLDPEEQEGLLTNWIKRAEELEDSQIISKLNYIKRVTAKLNSEAVAPPKQYNLKVLLGGNLWHFSKAEETEPPDVNDHRPYRPQQVKLGQNDLGQELDRMAKEIREAMRQ